MKQTIEKPKKEDFAVPVQIEKLQARINADGKLDKFVDFSKKAYKKSKEIYSSVKTKVDALKAKVDEKIYELKIPVLDKYIISEFWLPFMSGAAMITGVWLSADHIRKVFRLVTISNASISTVIAIIGLSLPQILVTTIPIGVLWGAFMVFTRLNNDSEIIAMRTSGISMVKIFKPVLIFGAIAGALSFGINELVVPVTNPLVKKLEIYTVYKTPFARRKHNFTYLEKGSNNKLNRIFYAQAYVVDKDLLKNLTILDFTQEKLTQIYSAGSAKWSPKRGGWVLFDGTNHFISLDDGISRVSSFDKFFIPSGKTPAQLVKEINSPREVNFIKLARMIYLQGKATIHTGDYLIALLEFHRKFASPIACILIAFVGAALGILPRRSSTSLNYLFLAGIIFQFYVMQSVLGSMAEAGKLSPFIAAWFPNLVLLAISVLLINRRSRMS